jgi:hypothetical protein
MWLKSGASRAFWLLRADDLKSDCYLTPDLIPRNHSKTSKSSAAVPTSNAYPDSVDVLVPNNEEDTV